MLLPPKSLRSRLGDSERFSPLQREGERFTADGEVEGREKRQGGAGGEKEERNGKEREREMERGGGERNVGGGGEREREIVYWYPIGLEGSGNTGWWNWALTPPTEPRKMPSCSTDVYF